MLPPHPSQSGPFLLTYSWARLQLCVLKVLSTEWMPKCAGLFGEQGLRKEPVCMDFFFFFLTWPLFKCSPSGLLRMSFFVHLWEITMCTCIFKTF